LSLKDWTPLHQAATMGFAKMCSLLVSAGSDVAAVTNEGQSPWDVATTADVRRAMQHAIEGSLSGYYLFLFII
jgi:ankyrin repeat protein